MKFRNAAGVCDDNILEGVDHDALIGRLKHPFVQGLKRPATAVSIYGHGTRPIAGNIIGDVKVCAAIENEPRGLLHSAGEYELRCLRPRRVYENLRGFLTGDIQRSDGGVMFGGHRIVRYYRWQDLRR